VLSPHPHGELVAAERKELTLVGQVATSTPTKISSSIDLVVLVGMIRVPDDV
jgi:hypothetical protein